MPATNTVDTVTNVAAQVTAQVTNVAAQVTSQVVGSLGEQAEQGKQVLQQGLGWLAQNGVSFICNILAAVAILFVGGLIVKFLVAGIRKALSKSKRVDVLLRTFICSVASKVGWAILLVVALGRLGVDVAPLVASLGVTGVVLGFAFKESLGSLAAGLMIALNHPFKVGDYVIAGGAEGSVTELNMMATVIATADNKKITVPNSSVWGSAITNFSALGKRRVDTKVGVAYGTDLRKAVELALAALKTVPGVLAEPAPSVSVGSLDDSEVTLNVRPWSTCDDYWAVYSAAQIAVTEAFEKAGIQIPFPQLDVRMTNTK